MSKKKGSSLVVVTIVMGILFTTGTALLSLVVSDYKMRINESKRIENMYKADSGLDIVYNVIAKNCEAAIISSDMVVKNEFKDKKDELDKLYNEINSKFKDEFINFLGKNQNSQAGEKLSVLTEGIINKKYMVFNESSKEFVWNNYRKLEDKDSADIYPKIEIVSYNYDDENKQIIVDVKSTFEASDSEVKNKKTISTEFVVKAPDYEETLVSESDSVKINIYPLFNGKAITADGDMNITSDVSIEGDIWIQGQKEELNDNPLYVFDKYRGGIYIKDGAFQVKGNVSTASNLTLNNNATVTVSDDVYALNTYVGKNTLNNISSKNSLVINHDLIVNNDLALNATESNITVKNNFYGISDKNYSGVDKIDTAERALRSSSIIVNEISSNNNIPTSTITVEKDSYIMGVAHIDATDNLGNKYETGESVAVKGNYLAYTEILPGYEEEVTLSYYNPLQLIDSINGNTSIEKKAEYINNYYKSNSNDLTSGGVNLKGEVNAVGAYIKDGNMNYSGWSENEKVRNKRDNFATSVFSMGDKSGIDSTNLYENGQVVKNVKNQIDFSKIGETRIIESYFGKILLNNTSNDVIIENNRVTCGDNIKNIDFNKGIIITSGNVFIDTTGNDEKVITGNVIALGNVEFNGNGAFEIKYDEDVTRKIIAANYNVLKDIFIGSKIAEVEVNVGEKVNIGNSSNGYDVSTYLSNRRWKILK